MLAIKSEIGTESTILFISHDEIEEYESSHTKMYNYLDDGSLLLWFDGDRWLFPKPEKKINVFNPNSELLQKISDQLEVLIENQNNK